MCKSLSLSLIKKKKQIYEFLIYLSIILGHIAMDKSSRDTLYIPQNKTENNIITLLFII